MNVGDLVQTLKYKNELSVQEIADEIKVSKQAVYGWIKGLEPSDARNSEILKRMVCESDLDIKRACWSAPLLLYTKLG